MEYFVQQTHNGSQHITDNLDISSISRDPLKEINILNSPTTMHTFETFRKAKVNAPSMPAPCILDAPLDETFSKSDLSLENEIMAALKSCQMIDKRRSMDIESILMMNSEDQIDSNKSDNQLEFTNFINSQSDSIDTVDYPCQSDLINDIESSPLSPSELDGLLNHPSLELMAHSSTPVGTSKPIIQPKPNLEKLKNSKNVLLARTLTNAEILETQHEKLKARPKTPDEIKDPAEMSLKERLALFEGNALEANASRKNLNETKQWNGDKWLERNRLTSSAKISNDFEMVSIHSKKFNNRMTASKNDLTSRNTAESYITKDRRTYSQELLGSTSTNNKFDRNYFSYEMDRTPKFSERSNKTNIASMFTSTFGGRNVEAKCNISGGRGRNDHSEMTTKLFEENTNAISIVPVERNQPLPMNGMRTSTVSRNGIRQNVMVAGDVTIPQQNGAYLDSYNARNGNTKEDDRCDIFMECLLFFCCVS